MRGWRSGAERRGARAPAVDEVVDKLHEPERQALDANASVRARRERDDSGAARRGRLGLELDAVSARAELERGPAAMLRPVALRVPRAG